MKAFKFVGTLFSVLLLITSLIVLYYAYSLKMLPMGYAVALGAAMLIVPIVCFILSRMKKGKKRKVFAIIFSLICIIVNLFGIYYLSVTNKALDNVTSKKVEVSAINVYVSKDDEANSINEAVENGYVFATIETDDESHIKETIDVIESDVGDSVNTKSYESVFAAVESFEGGLIDGFIISESSIEILDTVEEYADFVDTLKILMENTIEEEITEEAEAVPTDKDAFCCYFSGIDTFGKVSTKSRSDVNIIGVVNNNTKTVLLVSTPRDYYMELSVSNGKKDKLTHAGLYGIDCSVNSLEDFYDVNIPYYVRLNFSGFQNIIDTLGGIDVYSDYAFTGVTEEGTYSFTQGINHLNGEEALGFARERYAFLDGDRQRGNNQMQVIKATIEKMQSSEMLKNYSQLMDDMSDSFETSMDKDTIGYMVQSTISDPNWNVLTYSVSGSDSTQSCYSLGMDAYVMVPNQTDVDYAMELMNSVLNGDSLTQDQIDSGSRDTSNDATMDNDEVSGEGEEE